MRTSRRLKGDETFHYRSDRMGLLGQVDRELRGNLHEDLDPRQELREDGEGSRLDEAVYGHQAVRVVVRVDVLSHGMEANHSCIGELKTRDEPFSQTALHHCFGIITPTHGFRRRERRYKTLSVLHDFAIQISLSALCPAGSVGANEYCDWCAIFKHLETSEVRKKLSRDGAESPWWWLWRIYSCSVK